jgi:DNA ligase-1
MNLQRRKAFVDDEFTCVGVEISQEPRMEGLVGKLLFRTKNGVEFGVGTGFTKDERAEWAKNPPTGRVATIKYLYISKDGVPNNASFIGWRDSL